MPSLWGLYPSTNNHLDVLIVISINIDSIGSGESHTFNCLHDISSFKYRIRPPPWEFLSLLKGVE